MLKEEGDSSAAAGFLAVGHCAATWPSWCDSCRAVPCSVYCRADAAYLCGACDASIHSANSLARRHHRVPVLPVPSAGVFFPAPPREEENAGLGIGGEDDVDGYLDLVEFSSCAEDEKKKTKGAAAEIDGVVPVRCAAGEEEGRPLVQSFQMGYEGFEGGMDYSSTASSLGHNVPLSSMETAGVTESTMIDISSSQGMASNGIIELFSGPPLQTPHQFSPMDREARVLRYREKKKTRKFQKIIRYASRKAYAETRPRIKGRFAKRTDVEHEGDQMFDAPVMVEAGYGVVPSY